MPQRQEPSPCRLIIDGAAAGARQMAIDEALLESTAERGIATLRFYRWSEPTLSLGYFQGHAERDTHLASRDCALVRRQTGGGAILHDRELTYSLAIPRAHPLALDAARLYDAVHDALIEVLAARGVAARRLACSPLGVMAQHEAEPPQPSAEVPQPFLCFLRRMPGDVLVGDVKVCGSAQRRRRGAVLQHGSLLVARSNFAPELPGILETCGTAIDTTELAAAWWPQISRALLLSMRLGELSPGELAAADRLEVEKYRDPLWNRRR